MPFSLGKPGTSRRGTAMESARGPTSRTAGGPIPRSYCNGRGLARQPGALRGRVHAGSPPKDLLGRATARRPVPDHDLSGVPSERRKLLRRRPWRTSAPPSWRCGPRTWGRPRSWPARCPGRASWGRGLMGSMRTGALCCEAAGPGLAFQGRLVCRGSSATKPPSSPAVHVSRTQDDPPLNAPPEFQHGTAFRRRLGKRLGIVASGDEAHTSCAFRGAADQCSLSRPCGLG